MKKVLKPFKFNTMRNAGDFKKIMDDAGLPFPVDENVDILGTPVKIGDKTVPNRICIQPLEGFDGLPDGSPSELDFRRYRRYAGGGAGMIWYESIAISEDGRCNPLQMVIRPSTVNEIKKMVDEANEVAIEKYGRRPYNVLQLTHSGRRSNDKNWKSTPLAVCENPYMDDHTSIDGSSGKITIATDDKIEEIIRGFIDGAILAHQAGFDAVDIKICHEYILRELLSAFTRPGKFGGSFENRTRAVFMIIDGIREKLGDALDICVRLNAYDCVPYPYGWGMKKEEGVMEPDLTEPIKLCQMLVERDVRLINLSTMMPRYQPYGRGLMAEHEEGPEAEIDPYKGTFSLLDATRQIKEAVPGGVFVCTGLTWLEQFGGNVAAGGIKEGWFDIGGFGRQGFAYPEFARDLLYDKTMYRNKCCILCDKCYDLIQKGHCQTGCVMRDQEIYLKLYRENVMNKK
ncbi:MAG TPA: NADH:flavin oxidoreductase [Candidatus Mediterraneibacter norfolkensis]|nr:NADH:flavin oxidoreductase [Candidatus Mediterraneibacter norfolkensis]